MPFIALVSSLDKNLSRLLLTLISKFQFPLSYITILGQKALYRLEKSIQFLEMPSGFSCYIYEIFR